MWGKKRIVPEDFEGKKMSVQRSPVTRGGKKDYRAMVGKAPCGPVQAETDSDSDMGSQGSDVTHVGNMSGNLSSFEVGDMGDFTDSESVIRRVKKVQIMSPNSGKVHQPGVLEFDMGVKIEEVVQGAVNWGLKQLRSHFAAGMESASEVDLRSQASHSDEYMNLGSVKPSEIHEVSSVNREPVDFVDTSVRMPETGPQRPVGVTPVGQASTGTGGPTSQGKSLAVLTVPLGNVEGSGDKPDFQKEMGDNLHYHLFSHIENRVFDHILQGKYIDLARMITNSDLGDDREQRMEMVNNGGHAYWVPASKPGKKIDDYNTWVKAFRCFSGVLCTKYPHLAVPMMQYQQIIGKAAERYRWSQVYTYDKLYRRKISKKPETLWDQVDTNSWLMELGEPMAKQLQQGQAGEVKPKKSVCNIYNRKGSCSFKGDCRYEHKCSVCGKFGHPAVKCYRKVGYPKEKQGQTKQESNSTK